MTERTTPWWRTVRVSCAIAWLALPSFALGQVAPAALLGTVRDQQGALVSQATVVARNLETGQRRTVLTDSDGRYRVGELAPGDYELQVWREGFKTAVRSGLTLTVGREAVVSFELQVGEVTDQVIVRGDTPLVNTTSGEVAATIDERTIRELPLNGRDLLQLATLQAGVTNAGSLTTEPIDAGTGAVKMSINGARLNVNTFLLDGTTVNEPQNTTPGSVAGAFTGVDATQELQVLTSTYSAAYGAAGGVVNIVTKSGTNALRGTAFDFVRDAAFDARNYFDGPSVPPFERAQFGGSVGGPLRRDRTFFFAAYDGLRQTLAQTRRFYVPTDAARGGLLPSGPVAISPAICPYLDLYPLPNAGDAGGGLGLFVRSASGRTTEDYVTVRADHQFSSADAVFGRYTIDDSSQVDPDLLLQQSVLEARNQYVALGHTRVLAPAFVNSLRIGYNRSRVFGDDEDLVPIPRSLAFTPTAPTLGFFRQLGGLSPLADRGLVPRFLVQNSIELSDQAVYTRGAHTWKFGFSGRRIQLNALSSNTAYGGFLFGSYQAFLTGTPAVFAAPLRDAHDPYRGIRQTVFGAYVQDDWRAHGALTLNLGLRYELATVPTEAHGKVANLRDILHETKTTVGDPFFKNNTLNNIGPRLGLAWDLTGDGRTSLRGGYGIFYAEPLPNNYRLEMSVNDPFFTLGIAIRPPVQGAFDRLANVPGVVALLVYEFDPPSTYMQQWNLSLQRELAAGLALTAAYVGSHGLHLPTNANRNTSEAFTLLPDGRKQFPVVRDGANTIVRNPLRNPALATVRQTRHNGESSYHALQLGATRRGRDLRVHAAYTFGKSIDTSSDAVGLFGPDSTQFAQDPDNYEAERALSVFDVRHTFSLGALYRLPFGADTGAGTSRRVSRLLAGGWQINAIVATRSGLPFHPIITINNSNDGNTDNVERPSWAPGFDARSAVTGDPHRYFRPEAFVLAPPGQFGNVGRNVLEGPGLFTIDLSLMKSHRIGDRVTVQARAEAFNVLNRTNFALPSTLEVFTQGGVVPPNVGQITRTSTTSRQLQFGVKVLF